MIATWDGSNVVIDGVDRKHLPRAKRWAGRTAYLVGPCDMQSLIGTLREGDIVSGPSPGKISRVQVMCHGSGSWSLIPGDVWDLDWRPEVAASDLAARRAAVLEEALDWRETGAAVAADVWGKGHGVYKALHDVEVVDLIRMATHAGPQVALRASIPDAVEADLRGAYLAEMALPVPDGWCRARLPWSTLRRSPGVVCARVRVRGGDLPPLPSPYGPWSVWARGTFWGAWPIRWLRWAEDVGHVDVMTVAEGAVCTEARTLAPLAERIDRVKDRALRRILYTRGVGRHMVGSWWDAAIPASIGDSDVPTMEGIARERPYNRLDWVQSPPSKRKRPDWACWIVGGCAQRLVQAIDESPPGSVALAHVDAMWLRRDAWEPDPRWAIKAKGPLRVYGVGTYQIGAKRAAMGVPAWKVQTENDYQRSIDMREFAGNGTTAGRVWSSDLIDDDDATSEPITLDGPAEWRCYVDTGRPVASKRIDTSHESTLDV